MVRTLEPVGNVAMCFCASWSITSMSIARGVRDEHAARSGVERRVVKFAVEAVGDFDDAKLFHAQAPRTTSVAQSLDGKPSKGESACPHLYKLATPAGSGKLGFVNGQYFGRCEFAHSRACQMGLRGGRIARSFVVADNFSILSRQRQKAGNFGYSVLPSSIRLNAKVLGSMKKSASVSSGPSR